VSFRQYMNPLARIAVRPMTPMDAKRHSAPGRPAIVWCAGGCGDGMTGGQFYNASRRDMGRYRSSVELNIRKAKLRDGPLTPSINLISRC